MKIGDWLQVISLILVVVSAATALLGIQKYRNSRGIDYILNAEGVVDPMHHELVGADPALIRSIYRGYEIDDLTDVDCRSFPFMYSIYVHVSRMHFLISSPSLDLGLSVQTRASEIEKWLRDLALYKNHPAMVAVHRTAMRSGNFNPQFMRLADDIIEPFSS